MKRFVCIHGHFYQPPRENPWLERVETQDSAYPFHDWNARINAECYGPNAAARLLDDSGQVIELSRNYSHISFNFGPTLLSWLESEAPDVYEAILQADRESIERYSGHGSAIAQAYNHLIMPLANERDARTQVIWGIRDFERRFRRFPEGMWLPEAAVSTATLEILAEQGISYTILAPSQAANVRPIGETDWHDVRGERVDTTRPYLCRLPSGREIVLFFYNGAISREVAFNRLLNNGGNFADRLLKAIPESSTHDPLTHIATDGETYGHHHRFGDMALASALKRFDQDPDVSVTIYGEYLATHPPEFEVRIVENSSWSCVHGVERWRSNCGCSTGKHANWDQRWRAPLREAIDWLRDTVDPLYEHAVAALFVDPWKTRDAYIDVILDRSPQSTNRFFSEHASSKLPPELRIRALKLLELQRHLLLSYTSCAWFFDEISAIEPVQVLEFAARAIQLTSDLFEMDLNPEFTERLAVARSNLVDYSDGGDVYTKLVKPRVVSLEDVAAHSAISLIFGSEDTSGPAFKVSIAKVKRRKIGPASFLTGGVAVRSRITEELAEFQAAVLRMGDQSILCGIRDAETDESLAELYKGFSGVLSSGDLESLSTKMNSVFGADEYTLRSLFRDRQREVLDFLLKSAMQDAEILYPEIYEQQVTAIRQLLTVGDQVPQAFRTSVEYLANSMIRRELEWKNGPGNLSRVRFHLAEAVMLEIPLDSRGLGLQLERVIRNLLEEFRAGVADEAKFVQLQSAAELATQGALAVDLWDVQPLIFDIAHTEWVTAVSEGKAGNEERRTWVDQFRSLAARFSVRVP